MERKPLPHFQAIVVDHFLQNLMLPLPAPCLVSEIIFAIPIVAGMWKLLLSLLDLELGIALAKTLFAERGLQVYCFSPGVFFLLLLKTINIA